MELISGKDAAAAVKLQIADAVTKMKNEGLRAPSLVAVIVGDDPASQTYVGHKEKTCQELGFDSKVISLPESATQQELMELIDQLNNDNMVDGFIVQLPLPRHFNEEEVIMAINPLKDVDGFHPMNVGRMVTGNEAFVSATPLGIVTLLEHYNIETAGKNCVVVGRSNIVGRPVTNLLSLKGKYADATVTMCHSRTQNLADFTRNADILIVAIGQKEFIKGDMVKQGAVVIDVGIHRVEDSTRKSGFRLVGDVEFDTASQRCSMITPVPGGVGPMTIVSLMLNTLKAVNYRK